MNTNFLILPHQLYKEIYKHIDKSTTIWMWEHPQYFLKYKFNKKKIILHRASMKAFQKQLIKKGYSTKYVNAHDKMKIITIHKMFDPIDNLKIKAKTIIENPNFLITNKQMNEYRIKTVHFIFGNFYKWFKKKLNILPDVPSQDKYNRESIKKLKQIPIDKSMNQQGNDFLKEAVKYTNDNFPKNPGISSNFILPINRMQALKTFSEWAKNRFKNFGKYQDSMDKDNSVLFHSMLSSSINIGLIHPDEIIKTVLMKKINLPSLEGYIRQLFWREYQRYCYKYARLSGINTFGGTRRLSFAWYNGTTGIHPVDICIKRAWITGYLNHIERLMIIGNYMVLHGLTPKQGHKWFMEFSVDSYEWVMYQNVLDMVFFSSNTMRRPYITSSGYISKMSNYSNEAGWKEKWNALYDKFLKNNKKTLHKYRYFYPTIGKK